MALFRCGGDKKISRANLVESGNAIASKPYVYTCTESGLYLAHGVDSINAGTCNTVATGTIVYEENRKSDKANSITGYSYAALVYMEVGDTITMTAGNPRAWLYVYKLE